MPTFPNDDRMRICGSLSTFLCSHEAKGSHPKTSTVYSKTELRATSEEEEGAEKSRIQKLNVPLLTITWSRCDFVLFVRYIGPIVGVSKLDPLTWPHSEWCSLQIESDEPGGGDKENGLSQWEIEDPENLFIFPSLTATLKRPFHSSFIGELSEWETLMNRPFPRFPDNPLQCSLVSRLWSEQLKKILTRPDANIADSMQEGKVIAPQEESRMYPLSLGTGSELSKLEPLLANTSCASEANLLFLLPHQDMINILYNSCGLNLKDLSAEKHNSGSTVIDPSVSSTVSYDFCAHKNADFPNHSDYLVGNFSENSGLASSNNVDFGESIYLQQSSFQQLLPLFRTYTKTTKTGFVGSFERMFGLEGLLNDSGSGWKLVYMDFEDNVLVVGDDPMEEFACSVRCIGILSTSEVKQMVKIEDGS